ncbi:hypothetical protein RYX36_000441 [Vicia faba]
MDEWWNKWALLIASSKDFVDYRHQADVCHAYHVLKDDGLRDESIIVMMYADIASNEENPRKGSIYNRTNGSNIYDGVPKDYTGEAVMRHANDRFKGRGFCTGIDCKT